MGIASLVLVLVIDGLRPDSITRETTPNLDKLRTSGVWYTAGHSVFPTVTRANTASIATGTLPWRHGIVSNSVYLPEISNRVLSNGDYRNLLSLGKLNGGRVVPPKSLGEYFTRYVAISSGSTGNALLLNPTAPYGNGSLINPGFENGARVAFPDSLNAELLRRFGPVKGDDDDLAIMWTERVLREYVLDTLRPQVIVDWMGRTDSAQHSFGVGSPQGLAALRLVDQQIGLLLETLRQKNLYDQADIIVTSDHGFDYEPPADVLSPLREAKEGEVVADHEGGSSLFYVKDHDADTIARLAAKFQASPFTNVIFVASRRPANGRVQCSTGATKGYVPGTFGLELAHQCLESRGPDLIVTYRWDAAPSPFGMPGTQWVNGQSGQAARNGHGGLNPYVTHSTLLAAGPDFAKGKINDLPAGNQDIAPTLLAIFGLPVPGSMDGRVLSEALKKPTTTRRDRPSVRRMRVSSGPYCGELEISYAGDHGYLNLGRRCASGANLQ
jgi:arylsulfatase A-like enzyme